MGEGKDRLTTLMPLKDVSAESTTRERAVESLTTEMSLGEVLTFAGASM